MSPEQPKRKPAINEDESIILPSELQANVDRLIVLLMFKIASSNKFDNSVSKMARAVNFKGSIFPIELPRTGYVYSIDRMGNEPVKSENITKRDNEVSLGWQILHIQRKPIDSLHYTEDVFIESYQNQPEKTKLAYYDLTGKDVYKPNTLKVLEKAKKIIEEF